jgi:hypothetical protein
MDNVGSSSPSKAVLGPSRYGLMPALILVGGREASVNDMQRRTVVFLEEQFEGRLVCV